ncbi:MAG: hypothetical protein BGO39_08665 [Chloroflexi bacterium 54-19]|nr:MAG: hypothetical protein BGO39_08665 [Chloroflexi bacterium 54-19]
MGVKTVFSRTGKRFRLVFITAVYLLLTLVLTVPTAQAHSDLLRSDPPISSITSSEKMPGQLKLWFNEQPDITYSRIQITGPNGLVANNGNIKSDPTDPDVLAAPLRSDLPDGVYNVTWKVISLIDRHLTQGQFSFGIGPTGSSTQLGLVRAAGLVSAKPGNDATNLSIWSVLSRWLNYLAAALLVGCTLFAVLIWFPFSQNVNRSLKLDDGLVAKVGHAGWRRLSNILGWSLLLLFGGWLVGLAYQFLTESGTSLLDLPQNIPEVGKFLTGTLFGQIWLVRLGLILLGGVLFALVDRSSKGIGKAANSYRGLVLWGLLVGLGLFILLTTSLYSHAASTSAGSAVLAMTNDWVHLGAASTWVGGVISLALLLPVVLKLASGGSGNRTRLVAALVKPFSVLALLSLIILGITGALASLREINSVTTLLTTWYGQALLIKIVLVLFTLALGAGVWLVIKPRLLAFAQTDSPYKKSARSLAAGRIIFQFRQIITLEAILLVVVLVSVGILTSLAPPRNTPIQIDQTATDTVPRHSDPQLSATVGNYQLELVVSPAEIGPNSFTLYVLDTRTNQVVSDLTSVQLRFSKADANGGKFQVLELESGGQAAPGFYQANTELITEVGTWQIEAVLHKDGQPDLTYIFQLNVQN